MVLHAFLFFGRDEMMCPLENKRKVMEKKNGSRVKGEQSQNESKPDAERKQNGSRMEAERN